MRTDASDKAAGDPDRPRGRPLEARAQGRPEAGTGGAASRAGRRPGHPGHRGRPHPFELPEAEPTPGEPAELTLSELAAGGDAIGRLSAGLVVFVPGGAPGDRVSVRLEPPRKGYARAHLVKVLEPGPGRVTAPCPHAHPDACGGCPLMHVTRPVQLAAKESWVRRALRRSGAEVLPILAPAPELGYRVRARLAVRDGRLGFACARSHRGAAIEHCAVLDPALDAVLLKRGAQAALALGEGATLAGLVGRHDGRPAVQLAVTLGRGGRRGEVAAWLESLIAEGAIAGAILSGEPLGAACLDIAVGDSLGPLHGAADGFAQASAAGQDLLPRLVAAGVGRPPGASADAPARWPRLLELYAGSGNLTRALRPLAQEVVAIEGDAGATGRLADLPALTGGPAPITLRTEPVEQALLSLVRAGERFDVAVLDPPRAGAKEALPLLVRLAPKRIVYVSCDVMTLARDLDTLAAAGLRARTVQPLDLMPHTAQVECVAVIDAAV